jgi:class 3 adenylate cyclase
MKIVAGILSLLLFTPLAAENRFGTKILDLRSKKVLSKGIHPWDLKLGDSPVLRSLDQEDDQIRFQYAEKNYKPEASEGWVKSVSIPASLLNLKDNTGAPLISDFDTFLETHKGYVWYRTEVDLSRESVKEMFHTRNLVLRLGWIGQADAVYWNGEFIGSTGLSDDTPENAELDDSVLDYGKQRFYDIPADLLDYKSPNIISVRVYAKYPIQPGLAKGKFYISSREYADRAEYWDDFKKIFVITLTLLLGVFYLFWQFLFRKDEQATIYFALASLFMSLNTLSHSNVIYSVIDNVVWIKKFEYVTWIILFHLLISFLVKFSRLSQIRFKTVLYGLHIIGALIGVYLLTQSSLWEISSGFQIWIGIAMVSSFYLAWVLVKGRKTPSMATVLFGFLWLGLLLLNDILIEAYLEFYPIQIPMRDYAFGGFSLSIAFSIVKNMVDSQKLIQQQKAEKERLSKYFSPEVMKSIVMDKIRLGGEEKPIATLFSDIVGFTTFSENHTPAQVVERLNFLFEQLSHVIFTYNATLDKYIGDAIMAFWGAPTEHPLDAYRAVACAVEMQKAMKKITDSLPEDEKFFQLRIGVNYGHAIVGNIGSQKRMDYTVIGDAVNTAARLESNGIPGLVAVSESAFQAAGGERYLKYNEIREIHLKGKALPVKVYFVYDVVPRDV